MARFKAEDVDHYGGQGGGGFLTLQNDGDVAQVRFMYDSIDDVEGYAVHRVKTGTRDDGRDVYRYVNCLRDYNEPLDKCPFCANKIPVQAKLFIPVYDIKSKETKTWERGKKFFAKMSSICARYSHPVAKVFEIERIGAKGDMSTTYEVYPLDEGYDDKLMVADLPEKPVILGGLVLDKTAEDMEYYLEEKQFPPTEDEEDDAVEERPVRRGSERASSRASSRNSRRTPAGRGNREDAF